MEAENLRKNIWFVLGCLALIMFFFQFILGRLVQLALEGFAFHLDWNDVSFALDCVREPCIAIFALVAIGKGVRRKVAFRGISLMHLLLVIALVPPEYIVVTKIHNLSKSILNELKGEPPQITALTNPPNEGRHATAQMQPSPAFIIEGEPWWVVLLIGAAYPAVAEEICYRGMVGRLVLARFGAFWGVLLSSAFFGVMHMNLDMVPQAAIGGIVMHILFLSTKTILAPVLYHFLYNALVSTFLKLHLERTFLPVGPDSYAPVSPILVAAAAIAVIALLFLFYQTRVNWMTPDGQVWTPGYPSAEMPPPELNAHATLPYRPAACVAVAVLYLAFIGMFAANVPTWLALNNYWQLLAEARAKTAKEDYENAIADCDQAIQIVPDYARAYAYRGYAYRMLGKYEKAIADFNEVIRLDSEYAGAYESRGNALRANKDYDKAIVDYTEAIRLDPKNVFAYNNRGWTWYLKNDLDKAIADYAEAIQLNPKWGQAYYNRGYAYSLKTDYDKAIADFNEVIRLSSNDPLVYNYRGIAWTGKKDYDKAIADFNEAIRLEPAYALAYNNRGYVFSLKRDYDKAIENYNEALRLDPKCVLAYKNRGFIWESNREFDKAIVDYSEAIRLDPKETQAVIGVESLLQKIKKWRNPCIDR